MRLIAPAAIAAAYVGLAIVHTYPLVRHLDSHLPGLGLGDNLSFIWNLWWMRETIASPAHAFFLCPIMAAPFGGSLVLHTHTALSALVGATVLANLSVVEAQNVLIIATLALNGFSAYVLSYTVSGARGASVVAGAAFLVTPTLAMRLMGHFNLLAVWPLVLACAALVRWWQAPRLWLAVAFGVLAAAVAYTDYYYAVFLLLFVPAYGATELLTIQPRVDARRTGVFAAVFAAVAAIAAAVALVILLLPRSELVVGSLRISLRTPTNALTFAWLMALAAVLSRWRFGFRIGRRGAAPRVAVVPHAVLAVAVCALLVTPLLVPALDLWRSGDYVTQRSSLRSGPRGVDLATVVLGPPYHGLLGGFVRDLYHRAGINVMESSAWTGVATPLLLVIGLRGRMRERDVRRWLAVGAAFGLWALGAYLIVWGGNTGILLPQAAARAIPVIDNARIPGRAMALVALSAAVLTALVLAELRSTRRRHVRVIVPAFVVGALAESMAAPLPLARMPDPGVYSALREQPPGAVLTLPFGVRDGFGEKGLVEHELLYGQTVHGHPVVGGVLSRFPRRVWDWYETTEPYRTLLALSAGEPAADKPTCEAVAAGLRAASVSYIVLHAEHTTSALLSFVEQRIPAQRIGGDQERVLFRIADGECDGVTR